MTDIRNEFASLKKDVTILTKNDRLGLADELKRKYITPYMLNRNPALYKRVQQELDDLVSGGGVYTSAFS